jgi:hypothetical protein
MDAHAKSRLSDIVPGDSRYFATMLPNLIRAGVPIEPPALLFGGVRVSE